MACLKLFRRVFFPLQTLASFFYGFCQIDELRVWKDEKDIVDGSTTGWACRHLQLPVSVSVSECELECVDCGDSWSKQIADMSRSDAAN